MGFITEIKTFAALGSGVIGSGWVSRALAHGLDVVAWDPAPGAEAALQDKAWLTRVHAFNRAEREWLRGELLERGYRCLPSQTNFLLCTLQQDATHLERRLFEQGVIVRPMGGYGLPKALRISVGSRAENRRLLKALS